MMSEHDRADRMENQGNEMLVAMKKRYALSKEADARFMSVKEFHDTYRGT